MHRTLANTIIEYLHTKFPDASIALSGSVAKGSYTNKSDIDILFQKEGYKNSYYIYFIYNNIKIGIFSFNKIMFWRRNLDHLYNHNSMRLSYINNSEIYYDSKGMIRDLKEKVNSIYIQKKLLKNYLIEDLKLEIIQLLQSECDDIIKNKENLYLTLNKIISIFYLSKYDTKVLNKTEAQNPFNLIKLEDEYLYQNLKKNYPVHKNSYTSIKEVCYNHLFTNY